MVAVPSFGPAHSNSTHPRGCCLLLIGDARRWRGCDTQLPRVKRREEEPACVDDGFNQNSVWGVGVNIDRAHTRVSPPLQPG